MRVKDLLLTRGRVKLLSLLLAVVLWFFVKLEAGVEQEFTVRFEPVTVNPGMVAHVIPQESKVRLAGARILLLRQGMLGVSARIDLAKIGEGKVTIIDPEHYIKPVHGVKVVSVAPRELQVALTKR